MKKRRILQTLLFCLLLLWANVMTGVANDVGREMAEVTQQITVTGTVTDTDGETLVGVTIMVKGATTGTATDIDGKYTINVPNRNAVLTFSYVGFSPYEQMVGDSRVINVRLSEDTQLIDEVVVVGYGAVRKSDLTGAVTSLSSEKFKNLPQGGVTSILQGKAAGVNITSASGNGTTNIRIRGTTSINKSSEPLWVYDGVIGGVQGNFYDIESIEVLKDASATAIYGSQGANGVILVTTKKPQDGKAKITFDTRLGWSDFRKKPDLLSSYEAAIAWRHYKGDNALSDAEIEEYRNGARGVNWFDMMTQTGFSQSYNLNITGGSPKTKYAITAWAGDSKGQIITVTSRNYNLKAQLDTEILPWLNLSGYVYGSRSNSHNGVSLDQMNTIFDHSPLMPSIWDANLDGVYGRDEFSALGSTNPYASKVASYNDDESTSSTGYADLRIKLPVDGLTLNISGLYSQSHTVSRWVELDVRSPASSEKNRARHNSSQSYRIRNINTLNYQKQFGDHRLTATGVLETTKYEWSEFHGEAYDFLAEEYLGYWALGTGDQRAGQNYSNSAQVSVVGRAVYSYMGKYSFTGTYRADAPSQFIGKYKWGYFPSVGVAWNIAEEDFFNKDLMQQLKLRASWGISGNHGVGAYSTMATLTRDFAAWGTGSRYYGYWPSQFNNPNLHWEQTAQYNVGLDMSLINQRISVTTDWYMKKTTDLLFRKNLPDYNGGGSIWVNQGAIDNSGWELTVNAWPVRSKDFFWETNLTASYTKNTVRDLAGADFIIPDAGRGSAFSGGVFVLKPGKPIGQFWLQEFAGFNENGATLHYVQDGSGNTTTQNNTDNKKMLDKQSIPLWIYGFNNTLTWKNWDFNVFFRATGKYYRLNISRYFQSSAVAASRFISSREAYYKSWDIVTDKSKAEFASMTNAGNQYVPESTQWLENAMFLRCQNLSLGYQIPKSVTRFSDIHLSMSVQNLFVLSKYKGLDPETISERDQDGDTGKFDTTFGYDRGAFPNPRSFTFIARFNF